MKNNLHKLICFLLCAFLAGTVAAQGPYPATGDHLVCLNSVQPYGVINTPGSTYAWQIIPSTGGAGTITGSGSSVSITWNSVGTCILQVIETNIDGCVGIPVTIMVTVNPLPVPTITGPTPVCMNSTGNIYITETGMTNYTWNITGGTITAGQGTSSATVTWLVAGTQNISVIYTNAFGCTSALPAVYPVVVNPLPATSMIFHN